MRAGGVRRSLYTANAYVQVSLHEKTLTNKAKNANSPRPRYAVLHIQYPCAGTSGNANAMAVVQVYEDPPGTHRHISHPHPNLSLTKLGPNILLREPPRLRLQHRHSLLVTHTDLRANRHQTPGQVVVILPHEPDGDHDVVDVVEDEGAAVLVLLLGLHEGERVVAPVAARVEVVGGVPAVVEAVAVTLENVDELLGWSWGGRVQFLGGDGE